MTHTIKPSDVYYQSQQQIEQCLRAIGWRVVAFRPPMAGDWFLDSTRLQRTQAGCAHRLPALILERCPTITSPMPEPEQFTCTITPEQVYGAPLDMLQDTCRRIGSKAVPFRVPEYGDVFLSLGNVGVTATVNTITGTPRLILQSFNFYTNLENIWE